MDIWQLIKKIACGICGGTCETVEEIVAGNSAGMTDEQKAQYWYELSQSLFALLGRVEV